MMHGNNYTIIKAANRKLILNTIAERGAMSVMDILHNTRLSRPTIEALLRDLQQEGILEEVGVSKTPVGRSAKLYSMGVRRHFSIGVDFEYPIVRACAVNLAEQPVYTCQHVFSGRETQEKIISCIIALIQQAIDAIPRPDDGEINLLGIGVGICGLIDRETKQSVSIERIEGWHNVELVHILKEAFQIPVHMRNDVHMLSLIHQKQRMRNGTENQIYISLRSGIGMALFIHGQLFSGDQGNAGYFGHTTVDINGPRCCCGNRGCLETYMNPVQLAANYCIATNRQGDYDDLLVRFERMDEAASEVMRNAYVIFGKALSDVIKITGIRHVVVSGMPAVGTDRLIEWIHEGIKANTLPDISRSVTVQEERLEGDEAVGAGIYILRHFFADPKLIVTPDGL